MKTTNARPVTTPSDMAKSREWASGFFNKGANLPISFVLDGRTIRGIPATWQTHVHRHRIDVNISTNVFDGNDPATGLEIRVECIEYRDYPVMEWVAWFNNKGQEATPIIRDILASVPVPGGSVKPLVR